MKTPVKSIAAILTTLFSLNAPTLSFAHGDAPLSGESLQAQLHDLRRATAAYRDVDEALRAGYGKFPDLAGDCVSQPGQGAMGVHYLNGNLVDAVLDPLRPEALMYEPTKHGKLELVGVEYIVPQTAWDTLHPQPPALYGHPFHLVRTPNRYGTQFAFYELHVWVWEHNRDGLFNDWNPAVACR